MAIKVIVELQAKPGKRAELTSLLESVEAKFGSGQPGFLGSTYYEVLDNPDGELEPPLAVRQQVTRRIRQWQAEVVIAPRPNDYHPDHRYTGVVVQDSAYMVVVPNVAPDTPPLRKNPVFMYSQDHFQRPNPFRPDVAVDIDSVVDQKIRALDAHVSQVYEWLPWVDGELDTVPKDPAARLSWLQRYRSFRPLNEGVTAATQLGYRYAQAFDTGPTMPGQVYVATLTVGSASAASTVSAVSLIAIAA